MGNHAYGYVEGEKLFLKGFLGFPDREIGEIKDDEASTLRYFEEKFRILEKKADEIEHTIRNAENKGSYLMKLIHFKSSLSTVDALGDFEALYRRLEKLENELRALIGENRKKNLEIKRALLREAESLAGSTNWKEDGEKIRELKSNWVKTGNVDKEYEEDIEGKFSTLVNDFFIRRKSFFEEKNDLSNKRVLSYQKLIQQAEEARKLPTDKAIKELIRLQKEWKRVGRIPAQQLDRLWEAFRKINDTVFQHKQQPATGPGKRTQKLSEEEVLAEKRRLLKEIQNINSEEVTHARDQVKELRSAWKKLGKLSGDFRKMEADFFFTCEMVIEKNFINELTRNKFRGKKGISEKEKKAAKVQIVRDLLSRDQSVLETFQENMANMSINTDSANRLMNSQLRLQTRKVMVKKAILEELSHKKPD